MLKHILDDAFFKKLLGDWGRAHYIMSWGKKIWTQLRKNIQHFHLPLTRFSKIFYEELTSCVFCLKLKYKHAKILKHGYRSYGNFFSKFQIPHDFPQTLRFSITLTLTKFFFWFLKSKKNDSFQVFRQTEINNLFR